MNKLLPVSAAAIAALVSATAWAHPGAGEHTMGFSAGFAHPFGGLDHLLAMTGLGLWASGYNGKARFSLPVAFMLGMIGGGALAVLGVGLPGVEIGIAGSVVAIGALIALGARLPAVAAVTIAVLSAVFHGHAHGTEMSGLSAAVGVILATAVLHSAGLGLGIAVSRPPFAKAVRVAGSLMAAAGVGLLAAG
jgi:urease accessory protein